MTPLERVLARCEIGDCWRWQGAHSRGYGQIGVDGKNLRVHRVVWEALVAPIPDDLVIDHMCRVTDCVNPDHLRVVTQRENLSSSPAVSQRFQKSSHCPQGHPFSVENTYVQLWNGFRRCRICKADQQRRYKRKVRSYE